MKIHRKSESEDCFIVIVSYPKTESNMVYYFTSTVVSPPATIYMGLDKFENETLIKYGFPEDIWFHVDDMSSAHVYLRLEKNKTIDDISPELLQDCAQLVKANSIQGSKKNNIQVVYTEWSNLKKTNDMVVGQVAFHNSKKVRTIKVEKKLNDVLNRLNKTKVERFPCLQSEREERDRLERSELKEKQRKLKEQEKLEMQQKEEEAKLRNYTTLMNAKMQSNQDAGEDSDDFM
ncbi:coiled-coil domain-containing protein 25 [Trichonephila inaurata madagascariensis]|uniref:Coiled-coil domain-containing protein 25 n=1 Tax=Trichonephila inaurata madagascariensis TaxID=2747483 RepID=A0A8X7BPW3_9ARAC|nr:coiled-coil domain-containing protein 25 [Trichonephila inaurata madagascariensis]